MEGAGGGNREMRTTASCPNRQQVGGSISALVLLVVKSGHAQISFPALPSPLIPMEKGLGAPLLTSCLGGNACPVPPPLPKQKGRDWVLGGVIRDSQKEHNRLVGELSHIWGFPGPYQYRDSFCMMSLSLCWSSSRRLPNS